MKSNCDVIPVFIISITLYSLISIILLIVALNLTIIDNYLEYILLSAFMGIMSVFVSIFFVNRCLYKIKNDYKITREFIISVIIAFVLILTLVIADPEIENLDLVRYSGYIGIISVFASIFVVDKLFQKNHNGRLKI